MDKKRQDLMTHQSFIRSRSPMFGEHSKLKDGIEDCLCSEEQDWNEGFRDMDHSEFGREGVPLESVYHLFVFFGINAIWVALLLYFGGTITECFS